MVRKLVQLVQFLSKLQWGPDKLFLKLKVVGASYILVLKHDYKSNSVPVWRMSCFH